MTAHEKEETRLQSARLTAAPSVRARAKVDDESRKNSEWLRVAMASIGDGVIGADAQGRVTFLNPIAEQLTGWPSIEAAGRPLAEVFRIIDRRTRQPIANPILKAIEERASAPFDDHSILVARNGAERLVDDRAAPIFDQDGNPIGVVLVFRDATERLRSHEAQARLAAIVESTTDAIVSKSVADGVIRSWNAGAERLFGYSAEEAIGQPITLIIPPDRLDEERRIIERLRRGERVEHYDTVRLAKGGRPIDVSVTISPLFDDDGRVVGAAKIARDVSERKRMDQELRDRAHQLVEMDRKKDEFIALLAHELRNPMAPLRNGLEVMRLAADDPAIIGRTRAMMERQLGQLVHLVDDLLDISRFNRKKIELRRTRVLLSDVVATALETVHAAMTAAGHEFTLSLPAEVVVLHADGTRLGQVFGNLLSNSVKFTEPGGHVWLTAVRQGPEVTISVRDTGIGIPEHELPYVFDMFRPIGRGDRAGGLGVGLALAKGFVEMHGGTVTAASEGQGKGSNFTVRLPTADEEAVAATA